jgi:hypothetical protein
MSMTKRECEQIRDELLKHRLDLNVGKVKVISSDDPAEGNAPHRDNLQRILWDEDWHLVHFAGHSYYDEQHKEGYVLLPERLSTVPQLVDARSFAGFFREVPRFVYLSSCESSGDAFVFELANVGIPAVAGFRWNVAETSAFEYAMCFYRHLLAERCLEVAFWKARKEIHDHDATEENLIWASAMLIIQTHWQQADRG